ncbi:MAG TPA: branched-chain amino acid ABC transporter permease [Vicinamibacterales bacterium]|nr:branched-chain amino acid ABC transporter permease [Vicinamibacterales bacterium]
MRAWVSRYGSLIALAVAAVVPLIVPNEYYLQILTQAYVFAISACGLNVIVGLAGQLSLAHAGFFGIGAYAVALLATKAGLTFWLALPAGIGLCIAAGYVIGSVCLRSKGHYFAIFTLAVGIIIHLVIQKWESLTHGHVGVIGIPGPGAIGPVSFDSALARSYLALFFLAAAVVAVSRMVRSPLGRTLMAVRESEPLAAAVGIDVMAAKRMAFTISAALAGLAGGLFAGFIGFLGPESSNVEMTFNTLLYIMVGGIGSLSGPIAGTFIVYGLSQVLAVLQQYQMVIFGLALVLLILFMPSGLTGVWRSSMRRPVVEPVRAE